MLVGVHPTIPWSNGWIPKMTPYLKGDTCLKTIIFGTYVRFNSTADTQNDGPWKRWLLLNMAIFFGGLLVINHQPLVKDHIAGWNIPPCFNRKIHLQSESIFLQRVNGNRLLEGNHGNLSVPLPRVPPPPGKSRPYWGIINHHCPLIRPYSGLAISKENSGTLRFPWFRNLQPELFGQINPLEQWKRAPGCLGLRGLYPVILGLFHKPS